ncbi:exodeoxyribonuclease V alpha subunit [Paenibacillus sophorae]|uniref:ATP-dependent RecD-like DNA helicase n=1 Tax=Paenibacillus sophorae TaxID=1333845 RepID=A0A1H8H189_9BACL|nr:AAA family ATPase [Paenibacillus sophorae]QWU14416.1 ATP-dependent RecD-like DNA helicase [Paenibacillus sophorae]SEN50151.1 exodeoxyribonuclease V alpha subunit [Paenibacillus sophorae]
MSNIIELKLTPEKMMFPKREADNKNDFRIYSCNTKNDEIMLNTFDRLSIKGIMQRLELGVEYEAQIELDKVDPRFGASYNVLSIYQDVPQTMEGQQAFLSTLMTELQLKEVYKTYPDEDIVQLIIDDKFDYDKVRNFGPVVYKRIRNRIMDNLAYKEILGRLGKYGITYDVILKLEEKFGSKQLAIQKIEDCPYELVAISGWGFKRADKVAKQMGIAHDNPQRIMYGIRYTIDENQQHGHTFMYREDLLRSASEKLELEIELIDKMLDETDELKFIDNKISLIRTYNAEYYISKKLKEKLDDGTELNFDSEEFIKYIEEEYKEDIPNGLTHQQKDFFRNIQKHPVNLLVGFAGTGKSAMQKFLVILLDKLGLTYTFMSPSAKAAKVTKKYTGVDAQTIHRKIGYGMDKDEENMYEIAEDFVIIDEAGMTDVFILASLLAKIKNPKTRLLFCGDSFQLLSIQAGNFLHDVIESGTIPMTKLDIVFRQSDGGILDIATKIRKGQQFVKNDFEGKKLFGDNFLLHCVDQIHMEKGYKTYYKTFLETFTPEDIMVLTPTKKGKLGTIEINKYIQEVVNPQDGNKKEHKYGFDNILRVGDYVLNTVNMYRIADMDEQGIDVVNGDSGNVIDLKFEDDKKGNKDEEMTERDKKGIIVQFDDNLVRLDFGLATQLLHSWSYTIHKSQGSSSEAALCIVDKSNKFQISANLIYTAITRSKQKCIFLTQAETLNYAIRKVDNMRRNTHLCDLLKKAR